MQDVGNTIRRFNKGSPVATTFKTGIARSRVFTNPGCMMVVGDAPSVAITLWANVMQADRSSAWQVVFAATVATGESVWLPGGYLAQEFQLQAVTTAPISAIYLAEAPEDLP
jgi:CTP:molybdopterin cytidylyltransferase MocA